VTQKKEVANCCKVVDGKYGEHCYMLLVRCLSCSRSSSSYVLDESRRFYLDWHLCNARNRMMAITDTTDKVRVVLT
jgi:hypothetical protein